MIERSAKDRLRRRKRLARLLERIGLALLLAVIPTAAGLVRALYLELNTGGYWIALTVQFLCLWRLPRLCVWLDPDMGPDGDDDLE